MKHSNIERVIFGMLTENTGVALCDSGGDNGRMWQRNQGKTIDDFAKEKPVTYDLDFYTWERDEVKGENVRKELDEVSSDEASMTVSLFHYLPSVLELDDLCDEYNALDQKDWDGEAYGVSAKGEKWLKAHGFTYGNSWNTYNGEDMLSQTLQGTELKRDGLGEGDYVLVQVHGGADVRGGYTDAKLFKYRAFQEMINPCPDIGATLTRENGVIEPELSTMYDGMRLKTEDGDALMIRKADKLEVYPMWER